MHDAELLNGLKKIYGNDVIYGKGGFHVRDKGFISIAQARVITGIEAPERKSRGKTGGYGDYATMRKIVGRM